MRSFDMAQKWVSQPLKLPTVTDSFPKICCCGQDNITTYKRDYQVWTFSKRQPYKHHDNLRVFQGVSLLQEDDKERQPFGNKTSYKSSFIPYQLEPMKSMDNPAIRSSIRLGEPTCCGQYTPDFKPWTSEAKFPIPNSGNNKYNLKRFLSTTHADYIQHTLQRAKPMLQARQSSHRSKAPFEGSTTMRDDYIKWDLPHHPAKLKESRRDWQKGLDQVSFSTCESKHCPRYRDNHKDGRIDRGMMKCDVDKDQPRVVSSPYIKQ